jgi:hypothetical protein
MILILVNKKVGKNKLKADAKLFLARKQKMMKKLQRKLRRKKNQELKMQMNQSIIALTVSIDFIN